MSAELAGGLCDEEVAELEDRDAELVVLAARASCGLDLPVAPSTREAKIRD